MIEELLDNDLLKEQEKHEKRVRSGKFTPSSFGQCYRRQIWKRKGEPESDKPPIETLRTFRIGKLFHQMIQSLLPFHLTEVEVSNDNIFGYADIVTNEEVIDIKSQNTYAFKLMGKPEFVLAEQKMDHILQVCTYAYLLGKQKARLVYINKESMEIREFELMVDDYLQQIEKEIAVLVNWLMKDELPPPEPRLYKKKDGFGECLYCQFYTKCKGKEF